MQAPKRAHWQAALRVLRYLHATIDLQLTFQAATGAEGGALTGFVDSDWAGDEGTRRSTTGYFFTVGGGAIAWSSKKQPTVALSSVESEYVALSLCAQEATWLARLADEIELPGSRPLTLYTDSTRAANLGQESCTTSQDQTCGHQIPLCQGESMCRRDDYKIHQHRQAASRQS